MSVEDLEKYEAQIELALYREYRDVVPMFRYLIETHRRFYLANKVDVTEHAEPSGDVRLEIVLTDAWVWDMYRQSRFVPSVRIITFEDVNIEELRSDVPDQTARPSQELDVDGL